MSKAAKRQENLLTVLQRQVPKENKTVTLDEKIIDASANITVIELHESDRYSVNHYVTHLICKVLEVQSHLKIAEDEESEDDPFLTSQMNITTGNKQQGSNYLLTTGDTNESPQSSRKVVIFDEILLLEIDQLARIVGDTSSLLRVAIVQETDPLIYLGMYCLSVCLCTFPSGMWSVTNLHIVMNLTSFVCLSLPHLQLLFVTFWISKYYFIFTFNYSS